MWKFMKVLLKLFITTRLVDGIDFALHDPAQNVGDLVGLALCGWLIWKLWKKKPVEKTIPLETKKDRYAHYKMEWAQ